MTKGIVPSLVLLVGVVIAAVPWVLPSQASFVLPLLLIVIVFVLTLRRQQRLPGVSVFAAGLLMDILTAGPLGYWAIVFLIAHTLAAVVGRHPARRQFGALWLAFAGTAAAASVAGWALASLYFVRIIDWQPMLIGGVSAVLLFPLVAWPMRRGLGLGSDGIYAR